MKHYIDHGDQALCDLVNNVFSEEWREEFLSFIKTESRAHIMREGIN